MKNAEVPEKKLLGDITQLAEAFEKNLRGDIAELTRLLDVTREHSTPLVNVLAQELDNKQARLTHLVELQNRGYTEQEFNAFLTPTEKEAFDAVEKIFNPERIRLNLILASLYLTAFEVLRNSIIGHIKDFFVILLIGENAEQIRARMLDQYKQEVGESFDAKENYQLIPSCKWLQKNGVLSEGEIEEIKEIREYRHRLAHDLPELILSEDAQIVNLERFRRISREILRKVELFWIRMYMDIKGIVEDIPDEKISGAESFLDLIIGTVFDYLNTTQETEPA